MVHENVAKYIQGRLAQTTLSVSCRTGLTFARQLLIHLKTRTHKKKKYQNVSAFKDIEHKLTKNVEIAAYLRLADVEMDLI